MAIRYFNFVLIVAALFSWGCGGNKNKSKEEQRSVFRYNESAGISSLDPAFARDQANIWAVNQIYNGLVQMNDKLEVIPCIAKSWNISEDGLKYTFTLRNDVYFHEHAAFKDKKRKVVAADFVNSFFRIIDETVASPGAWIFNNIDRTAKNGYLGFEAENDTVLNIYLSKPFPPFLGLLTMQYCSVIPIEVVDYYGKDFRNNPVGTGPFKFKMWKEGVKLVLMKNEGYFEKDEKGTKLPYLDAVSVSFVNDKQTEFLDFIKGNLDFISGLDGRGSYKDEIITRDGKLNDKYADKIKMQSQPYLNTEFIGINMTLPEAEGKNNPLKMKAVRQAINYGFDRKKLISFLRNNIGSPATSGITPMGLPSFDSKKVEGYDYNPEKAKQLLMEAGFPGGKGLPEIKLSCTEKRLDIFEFIQSQLNEVGIKIKLDVNASAVHRQMEAKGALQMFWKSWIADYPDAENYFALFYSKNSAAGGPNTTNFKNQLFDVLYEQAQTQTNDSIRFNTYQQMDRLIVNEAPLVPLYYDQVVRLTQKNIEGMESNAMNLLTLKKVKKGK